MGHPPELARGGRHAPRKNPTPIKVVGPAPARARSARYRRTCYVARVPRWVMVWCGAVSALLILTGCDADCCGISDRKVHLTGDPLPDSSSCAEVFLDFYEGHSSSCSGMCSVS